MTVQELIDRLNNEVEDKESTVCVLIDDEAVNVNYMNVYPEYISLEI